MFFMSAKYKVINTLIAVLFLTIFLMYPNEFERKYYKLIVEEVFEASNAPNVALGSSTIENFDFSVFRGCGEWRNLGVGNSKIASYLRFVNFLRVYEGVKNVVIYHGENDIVSGVSVDVVYSQYQSLIARLNNIYPNAIFHIVGIKYSPARKVYWDNFFDLNSRLKSNLSVTENFKFHTSEKLKLSYFSQDGIHLNSLGYQNFFYGVMRNC